MTIFLCLLRQEKRDPVGTLSAWFSRFVPIEQQAGTKSHIKLESLILAQNELWRQALYMQVERPLRREWQTGA